MPRSGLVSKIESNGLYPTLREALVQRGGGYGQAVEETFDDLGLLRGCETVCLRCVQSIRRQQSSNSDDEDDNDNSTVRSDFALINGLFCGPIPDELKLLTATELSLVCLVNPISRTIIATKFTHSTSKVFAVLNDVKDVATKLPNMRYLNDLAYLKSPNTLTSKLYSYRPNYVKRAQSWLLANNTEYQKMNIQLQYPAAPEWNDSSLGNDFIDPQVEELEEDDVVRVNAALRHETGVGGDPNATGLPLQCPEPSPIRRHRR